MKKLMIKESAQTVKAKQLKPGMKTAQGVIKSVVHDYLHGKPGVNVNYSTNGHAISDWFYDDKDVEIELVKESKSIKEDALDDFGVSKSNADMLSARLPDSKFYIDDKRYVLGRDLTDYFDEDETIIYSQYINANNIRIPNSYRINGRTRATTESIKESYSGPYSERMFEYTDLLDEQGLRDLVISFVKWMSDDEVGQFARANDITTVFEESKQPTTGKLNIKED